MGNERYIFVGGLHRSGTSLIATELGKHVDIASITNSDVPEDEGVYLQGAIPHKRTDGVPGEFAFDAQQHLIETSAYNTRQTLELLDYQWDQWYDTARPWRLEKSPVNLLRSRLYQCLFPRSLFIFIVRHPFAVSGATQKWTDRSVIELLDHWSQAYSIVLEDCNHLHNFCVVRYEDFVQAPSVWLNNVYRLCGLRETADASVTTQQGLNARYFEDFPAQELSTDARYRRAVQLAHQFGYSFDAPTQLDAFKAPQFHHYYRSLDLEGAP